MLRVGNVPCRWFTLASSAQPCIGEFFEAAAIGCQPVLENHVPIFPYHDLYILTDSCVQRVTMVQVTLSAQGNPRRRADVRKNSSVLVKN